METEAPPANGPGNYRTALTVSAVIAVPAIYLLYVAAYAVDIPQLDEWVRIPLLNASLQGHLTLGALWAQYNESRMFVSNLIFVASARLDHYDTRTLMFLSAGLFIVAYWIYLVLFRAYNARRIGPISALALGAVWFSFADVQNELWAFQINWYLTVTLLVAMAYLLLVPNGHRWLWFGLAALAAVAASLSVVQGFTLWIVGLICLIWNNPREKGPFIECSAWLGIGAVTTALYSIGYNFGITGCLPGACGIGPSLHHPVTTARFFLVLIGNVLPSGYLTAIHAEPTSFGFQEFVGVLVLVAAIFVVVQSVRERHGRIRLPVPVVLIAFALLFDVMLAVGRAGNGELGALANNRFVMPNLLLLVGIVSYALAHVPPWPGAPVEARSGGRRWLQWSALGLLSVFVVVQAIWATKFGLDNGQSSRTLQASRARTVVNLQRQPQSVRDCEVDAIVFFGGVGASSTAATNEANRWIDELKRDQLSIFYPSYQAILRSEGAPPPLGCG
jgi:hypothetical protein